MSVRLLNDPMPARNWTQPSRDLFKPGSVKTSNPKEELTLFPMALGET